MKHVWPLLFSTFILSPIVEASLVETDFGSIEIPDFEDFVDAHISVKQGIQESQKRMGSDTKILFVRVKSSEAQLTGNLSEMLVLSILPNQNNVSASELRSAASTDYQKTKEAMATQKPSVSIGNLVIADGYYLIPMDIPILDLNRQQSTLRTINGRISTSDHLFAITANIITNDDSNRDLFTAKIRTWIECICAKNSRYEVSAAIVTQPIRSKRTNSPFGSFIMPPSFEPRGGYYGEVSTNIANAVHVPMPRFVLQQHGLNEGKKESFAHYARMLQDSISLNLSFYLSQPAGQKIDLSVEDNPVRILVLSGIGASRLLSIETAEMCYFGGRKSIKVVIKRQLGKNPPVRVITFLTPTETTTVQTIFSYRISDSIDWASEIYAIVNSFEFNRL